MMIAARRLIMSMLLPVCLCSGGLAAADWAQWRGPDRTGFVASESAWPGRLADLEQRWQLEQLGKSYAGSLLVGDLLIDVSSSRTAEHCHAYALLDGTLRWQQSWAGTMSVPFFAAKGGNWVRSTPASDGEVVVVPGMLETLRCFRLSDGERLWEIDFPAVHGTPRPNFGHVASPLIAGDRVYVQAAGGVVALELATGREVWRQVTDGGGMWGNAFSSPMLVDLVHGKQLVVQSRTRLLGLDLDTGGPFWQRKIPAFRGMNILTPIVDGQDVFTASYGGGARLIRIDESGKGQRQQWDNKIEAYMSSPLLHDGHVYFLRRDRKAACLRLSDGQQRWVSKERFGEYWSLVGRVQGDRAEALALDERGLLFRFALDPAGFKLIDKRRVSERSTWAHLAMADSVLAVRDLTGLTVWRVGESE